MRRLLAAFALAVTVALLTLPALPAAAQPADRTERGFLFEVWTALRFGWLGDWSFAGSHRQTPEAAVLQLGGGVDPNGVCGLPLCPPPGAAVLQLGPGVDPNGL